MPSGRGRRRRRRDCVTKRVFIQYRLSFDGERIPRRENVNLRCTNSLSVHSRSEASVVQSTDPIDPVT